MNRPRRVRLRLWRLWPAARLAIALVLLGGSSHAHEHEREDAAHTGGATTVFDDGPHAYGRMLANLDPLRWSEARAGKQRFVQQWARRGPWADALACVDCHYRNGRGPRPDSAPPEPTPLDPTRLDPTRLDSAPSGLSVLLRLGRSSGGGDPVYGAQLRRIGHGVPSPGQFTVRWRETRGRYPSGERYSLRRPDVRVSRLAHGPLDAATRWSLRAPPAVFGLGLIEAIPDSTIVAFADPHDVDRDGISGRAQRVRDPSTGQMVLGRFGWKAAQPSLAAQSTAALAQDLGVSVIKSVSGSDGDVNVDVDVIALVRYMKALGVPARRRWMEPAVREGERLFADIGCGTCHRPDAMTTRQEPGWPELSRQAIRPYTDILLHDMGPALADGVAEADAAGREWRTPPLWGLGLVPVVNGEMRLLHDGRARSPEEAILWHDGEAARARHRFMTLPRAKREALMTFLASL